MADKHGMMNLMGGPGGMGGPPGGGMGGPPPPGGPLPPQGPDQPSTRVLRDDEVREQDRFLPTANISRIMKKSLPPNAKIAKDAKDTTQECVSEFISFITMEGTYCLQKSCDTAHEPSALACDSLCARGSSVFRVQTRIALRVRALRRLSAVGFAVFFGRSGQSTPHPVPNHLNVRH